MNRTRLRVQTAGVLALVILVGWPQFRSIRAITVWRESGPLTPRPELIANDPRIAAGQAQGGLLRVGYGSLRNLSSDAVQGRRGRRGRSFGFSPAVAALGGRINAIDCQARTSLNRPVSFARVALRDITTGRIEARGTADKDGRCAFVDVASSSYVIELVGGDGSVLASSTRVGADDGELQHANVFVSSDATVGGIFGDVRPGASETVARAAETGAQGIGQPIATNSPQQ